MSELQVKIVTMPPGRFLSAYGFGASPEGSAAEKMKNFLQAKGLWESYGDAIPHYGFNNPNPTSGSPNYGYEIWAGVPEQIEPQADLKVVLFPGGRYAVTRFENLENIGRVWKDLVHWRENSSYLPAHHQWLEHLLNPRETDPSRYDFELFLPVR